MISLLDLWAPILVAAVLVFVASSLIHMVFRWHNSDYWKLANEDEVAAALRKANAAPGLYMIPHCIDMKEMQSEAMQRRFQDGPVAAVLLRASGLPNMGKSLGQWFAFNIVIAVFAAYLASRTLGVHADPAQVFRVVATICFLAYAGGSLQEAIWYGKPWRAAFKEIGDGLIYGAVSGLAFAWLWPGA
jgi:hypothetical protein